MLDNDAYSVGYTKCSARLIATGKLMHVKSKQCSVSFLTALKKEIKKDDELKSYFLPYVLNKPP